jgi:hypothetical protein
MKVGQEKAKKETNGQKKTVMAEGQLTQAG